MTESQVKLLTAKSDLLKKHSTQISSLRHNIDRLYSSGNDSDGYNNSNIPLYSMKIIDELYIINPKRLKKMMLAIAGEFLNDIEKEIENTSLLTILSEIEKG